MAAGSSPRVITFIPQQPPYHVVQVFRRRERHEKHQDAAKHRADHWIGFLQLQEPCYGNVSWVKPRNVPDVSPLVGFGLPLLLYSERSFREKFTGIVSPGTKVSVVWHEGVGGTTVAAREGVALHPLQFARPGLVVRRTTRPRKVHQRDCPEKGLGEGCQGPGPGSTIVDCGGSVGVVPHDGLSATVAAASKIPAKGACDVCTGVEGFLCPWGR